MAVDKKEKQWLEGWDQGILPPRFYLSFAGSAQITAKVYYIGAVSVDVRTKWIIKQ